MTLKLPQPITKIIPLLGALWGLISGILYFAHVIDNNSPTIYLILSFPSFAMGIISMSFVHFVDLIVSPFGMWGYTIYGVGLSTLIGYFIGIIIYRIIR